jgi:serine/threonine-protein kinase
VKLLHQDLDPGHQAVRRLRDEGRMLGILDHPCIVKVFDLVLLEGHVALVAEYVEGADLDQWLEARPPLPQRALVQVVERVAEALDAAYTTPGADGGALQLVHRDVKPSNIRIGRHGEVKLLDFGIAKATNWEREANTQTDTMMGSSLNMAPERFRDPKRVTPASDVFGLGTTLYRGIVGEPLFGGLSLPEQYAYCLDAERFGEFITERLENLGEAPAPLVSLLTSTLAYDPDERPTALDVARRCEALSETLEGEPLRRWCRDRAPPVFDVAPGTLDGRTLTEEMFFDGSTVDDASMDPPPATGHRGSRGSTLVAPLPSTGETGSRRHLWVWAVVAGVFLSLAGVATVALALYAWLLVTPATSVDAASTPDAPPTAASGPAAPPAEVAPAPAEATTPSLAPETASTPAPAPAEVASTPAPEPVAPAPTAVSTPAAPVPAAPAPVVQASPPPSVPVVPAAKPPPAPAPSAGPTGFVQVSGTTDVELRHGDDTFSPGEVPTGTYALWPDFGDGHAEAGQITVGEGQTITIQCSRLRQDCFEAP